jgi:carbonic anhydrase
MISLSIPVRRELPSPSKKYKKRQKKNCPIVITFFHKEVHVKELHRVKLSGPTTQKYSDNVLEFKNNTVTVTVNKAGKVATLKTNKGVYSLVKHETLNMYYSILNGVNVHFTHKAWVSDLIYWS